MRAVLYSVNILSFFSRSRSDMAWMIFLFNQGGSLDCFTRLWRAGACILTTSINSLYHTARASLESVSVSSWCTLPNDVQIRSAKNAVLVKMFKRCKHLCMPFGFWFWQFDRSGAANRVTYGDCVETVILNAMCLWPCWWRMNKLRRLEAFAVSPLWSLDISWCVLYDCVKYFHYTRRVTSKQWLIMVTDVWNISSNDGTRVAGINVIN